MTDQLHDDAIKFWKNHMCEPTISFFTGKQAGERAELRRRIVEARQREALDVSDAVVEAEIAYREGCELESFRLSQCARFVSTVVQAYESAKAGNFHGEYTIVLRAPGGPRLGPSEPPPPTEPLRVVGHLRLVHSQD